MATVTIRKARRLNGQICAPSSKSYTQRMTIAAALSCGVSKVSNPLLSEDTKATLRAVTALGAKVKISEGCWTVEGAKTLKGSKKPIDCGESGATLRFMVPIAALADGSSILIFRGSFDKRPVDPLLVSLEELGAKAHVGKLGDKEAVFVEGGGIVGGETYIAGDVSSQFISGLMFACPRAEVDTEIMLTSPLESKDYVKMTENVLDNHGIKVPAHENHIHIPAKQTYMPSDGIVPGDFSSASFILAAAAITESKIQVTNLNYNSIQGDKAIMGVLKQMGVEGKVCEESVEIEGSGNLLKPVEVDAKNIPDLVPVIAALACHAQGVTHIFGAHRLRLKESNRLESLYLELTKMGAQITLKGDGLIVQGGTLHGATIDSHNDHRIAMTCAVAALLAEGETTIQNADCVRKSYPQFFTHLKQIGVDLVGGKFDR